MRRKLTACAVLAVVVVLKLAASTAGQEAPARFGGSYAALDAQRQVLVNDWVARFSDVMGQKIEPQAFYDTQIKISEKTTFEAITHALTATALTDEAGNSLGNALGLIERIDGVRGKIVGAAGDRQFRMYVLLHPTALETMERSRQFDRRADNTIFHKGYPINYRATGGTPSIQISTALDRRHADVDVDYRSPMFPVSMFNGHLTASNSDVRAGNNYDRHAGRWTGLPNWWRNFFGIRVSDDGSGVNDDDDSSGAPRAGKKSVDLMVADFLTAWLVEGDIKTAIRYVSPKATACLAQESSDPDAFDAGMAPIVLARRMKAVHNLLGPQESIDNLLVGVRLSTPGLRLVTQRRHAQFVVYAVPDDIAAAFECESRQSAATRAPKRQYGNYFGTTFYIRGPDAPTAVALLWAREGDYWRIVSWQTDPEGEETRPKIAEPPAAAPVQIAAEPGLADAARGFLESWLIRKDYDAAFGFIAPKAYACYDLLRGPGQPAATSLDDAGKKIRAALEQSGKEMGNVRSLAEAVVSVPLVHPAVRLMDHRDARSFTLSSVPNAIADAADCGARSGTMQVAGEVPPEYGKGFGMNVRFHTRGGDSPVLRTLWARENNAWRITAYDIEVP